MNVIEQQILSAIAGTTTPLTSGLMVKVSGGQVGLSVSDVPGWSPNVYFRDLNDAHGLRYLSMGYIDWDSDSTNLAKFTIKDANLLASFLISASNNELLTYMREHIYIDDDQEQAHLIEGLDYSLELSNWIERALPYFVVRIGRIYYAVTLVVQQVNSKLHLDCLINVSSQPTPDYYLEIDTQGTEI